MINTSLVQKLTHIGVICMTCHFSSTLQVTLLSNVKNYHSNIKELFTLLSVASSAQNFTKKKKKVMNEISFQLRLTTVNK
ncbi:CLUMA_CG004219, isoform A [Clunio marinus]|uniref:CLUMA_CG004219, isoform A n=1 Tax=Clunio marinus TaxID=568069 RepID=A0A1J1HT03_9DIPT|nr:CLUMA_CG004219, isoform A [Clunio marinus]